MGNLSTRDYLSICNNKGHVLDDDHCMKPTVSTIKSLVGRGLELTKDMSWMIIVSSQQWAPFFFWWDNSEHHKVASVWLCVCVSGGLWGLVSLVLERCSHCLCASPLPSTHCFAFYVLWTMLLCPQSKGQGTERRQYGWNLRKHIAIDVMNEISSKR